MSDDSSSGSFDLKTLLSKNINIQESDRPDTYTRKEEAQLETEEKKIANSLKRQELEFQRAEHDQRINYAKKVFRLIIGWLIFIFVVVLASGLVFFDDYFKLSDKVIITLLTTTTISVVGLLGIVLKYLFGKK